MLFSIHSGIAALTARPELVLTEGEAKALAEGVHNVARHYEFLNGASQQVIDWTNLMTIAAMIYGPRIYNMQREAKPRRAAGNGAVATATMQTPPAMNYVMDIPPGPYQQ